MDAVLCEVQNGEQTQELRISDGMPDIGRILAAWGQPILRGKEWRSDGVAVNGGILVWVLYAPEDGTEPRCVDSWLPFQMKWDLPDNTPEGKLRIQLLSRFVDARSISARKIMLRGGSFTTEEAKLNFFRRMAEKLNCPVYYGFPYGHELNINALDFQRTAVIADGMLTIK